MEFLGRARLRRQVDQREGCLGELPPDCKIFGRDRKPAIPEHVPSGLGDVSGSLPCNFIEHRLPPWCRVFIKNITMVRRFGPADRIRTASIRSRWIEPEALRPPSVRARRRSEPPATAARLR